MNLHTKYSHRFIARVVIEAVTPLAVGSGTGNIESDMLVVKDVNGLPYIPGTSIAGVLRHLMPEDKRDIIFGFQKSKRGEGSKIMFSDARMIGSEGKVIDGIVNLDRRDSFYSHFMEMPVRQHVRISSCGTGVDGGKFDEQIAYKGVRFCFEVEMVSENNVDTVFLEVLEKMCSCNFRLGGGTRKGFGEVKVVSCHYRTFDLSSESEFDEYLEKSTSLAEVWNGGRQIELKKQNDSVVVYCVKLKPEDFFIFGSGMGDNEADMTPVREDIVIWNELGIPSFSEDLVLVPASSVKGALSHRVAFYWNKYSGVYADVAGCTARTGGDNPAVKLLFGSDDTDNPQRGNVIFSDVHISCNMYDKLFNHVAVDQFACGAVDGALFSEKTVDGTGLEFALEIKVGADLLNRNDVVRKAFESALEDLCCGMLPLGGGVNRGNGTFKGHFEKKEY